MDTDREPVIRTRATMGTVASVRVLDDIAAGTADAAISEMFAELDRLEAAFSTYRDDSLVSRVNRGALHVLDAGQEVVDVLDACAWLEQVSGGAFSIDLPDGVAGRHAHGARRIDPSGFVKGWATERAAGRLDDAGLRHWYVAVGGDVVCRGAKPDGSPWHVALADPNHPGEILGVVDLVDSAVATSGTAERGLHIWDGRDGDAADALASLTVIGPHLTWADAFATAAFVMGVDGVEWVSRFDGYSAIAVTHDGTVVPDTMVGTTEPV
jgi:thiamine biosynthesis lipoprotein